MALTDFERYPLTFGPSPVRWVDWDDPGNDRVGNIELSRILGADVRLDDAGFDIGIRSSWEQALDEVKAAGGTP